MVISVAVAVHPPNAFPLQPDYLINLATRGNLKTQTTNFHTENRQSCSAETLIEKMDVCVSEIPQCFLLAALHLTTILMVSYRPCVVAVPPRMAWAIEMNMSEWMSAPLRLNTRLLWTCTKTFYMFKKKNILTSSLKALLDFNNLLNASKTKLTLKVMRISLLPTDIRTVWPSSTPVRKYHRIIVLGFWDNSSQSAFTDSKFGTKLKWNK